MEFNSLQNYILNNVEVNSGEDIHALREILEIIRNYLGMDVAFISEFKNNKRILKLVSGKEKRSVSLEGCEDDIDKTYCKMIVDNKLSNIIPDTSQNFITKNLEVTEKLSIGSYIGVPINLQDGSVYGTLCCFKNAPDKSLRARDLFFVKAFSELAGKIIDRKIKEEENINQIKQRVLSVLNSETIKIHFQPIYSMKSKKIFGFEALARFDTNPYRPPNIWFDEASQAGLGEELEIFSISSAIEDFKELNHGTYLSINSSPEYIINGAVESAIKKMPDHRFVVEVTEHSPIKDYKAFRESFNKLRNYGALLAVDDAGAGNSGFRHIVDLHPDIIKLDISLTRNIHIDKKRYALASAICAFADSISCEIVAEGVELQEELNTISKLGIDKVQGYFIGKPMPLNKALNFKVSSY